MKRKQNTIKYESEEETLIEKRKDSTGSCGARRKSNEKRSKETSQEEHADEGDVAAIEATTEAERTSEAQNECDEDTIENLSCFVHNVIVTNASVDIQNSAPEIAIKNNLDAVKEENCVLDTLDCIDKHGLVSPARSACVSPASSNGGVYSVRQRESRTIQIFQ